MANSNGWGDGASNNNIGWGKAADNAIGWGKSQLDSWSGATDIDGGNLPSNSVAPAITGTAQEGQTLTCLTGTWSGSPSYTYQWKRNGNNIGGATNSTYLLVLADVGTSIKCTVTATNFVGSATADSNTVTPTSSVDADAQAFITAASITDPTQQSAVNDLVVGLKADGLWTKSFVLYPIVGGVSTAHAVNLKSPGTYNMSLSSGWSHSANGMIGTNAYVDTQFNPTTAGITKSNFGVSVYSRSNTSGYKVDIGVVDSVTGSYVWLVPRFSASLDFAGSYDDSNFNGNYLTNTLGLISVVRDSSTTQKLYQAGVQKGTRTGFNATADINLNIYFGARNNSTIVQNYSDRQYAFVAIHQAFNSTEMANFNTRIQTYQTTLNRQV